MLAPAADLRDAKLERVIPLQAEVHHVQGIVVDGARLYVTAVNALALRGMLHEFELPSGRLIRTVEIHRGAQFHPGGMSASRDSLWIPVAEYRRNSSAVIQRRSKRTLALESEFAVADHIGCVAVDGNRIFGGNWDSRQIYEWDLTGKLMRKRDNPTGNSFQDIKAVNGRLVGGGFVNRVPAIDWFDRDTLALVHRMDAGKTDRGAAFTREGLDLHGSKLYLLPEDDPSRLFVFELPAAKF